MNLKIADICDNDVPLYFANDSDRPGFFSSAGTGIIDSLASFHFSYCDHLYTSTGSCSEFLRPFSGIFTFPEVPPVCGFNLANNFRLKVICAHACELSISAQ